MGFPFYFLFFWHSLLALSPEDVLPAVYLCTNKIAADHENMVCQIPFLIILHNNRVLPVPWGGGWNSGLWSAPTGSRVPTTSGLNS